MADELSTWILQELDDRDWSMRKLARRIGVSASSVSDLINGKMGASVEMCKRLAHAFNVPQESVMRRAGILAPEPPETASLVEANRLFAQLTEEERQMKIVEMRALIERRRSAELTTDTA
jgi:transcriptional regulator with XRE-family HTH domain